MLRQEDVPAPTRPERARVAAWFDDTYRRRGLSYLRPASAYPIYLQLLHADAGHTLLDVGCGPGLLLAAAVDRAVVAHGVDVSRTGLHLARQRVPAAALSCASVEELPYAARSFDLVTCIGVLERVHDRSRALAEIHRVCRPDARLCVMVRNADSLSWRLRCALRRQDHASHQDAATLAHWRALFTSHGLRIESVLPDQWLRQRLRRLLRGRHDAKKPEPIARSWLPLRLALEFIFVLRKAPA
jgi:cyclopropane fatty-acyl-phospholipid synthase-like methyltransferase